MRLFLTFWFVVLTGFHAQAEEPWGRSDHKMTESMHEKACVACHARMYGDDGSKMYTRDGRMLSNKLELLQRVTSCSAVMSAGWFPEEEGGVASWLNDHYYHFEQ
ncbi:MAG: hypothetical protein RIR18_1200 [Pseudomonadota bacterium]|jgi:hypothetical protein